MLLHFFLFSGILIMSSAAPPLVNQLLGIKYISYHNFDGTIENGDCCDEPGKTAGSCTPDLCDTAFTPCATSDPANLCNIIQSQRTPVTYNKNSITFGSSIGNLPGVHSTNFLVVKFPFDKNNINFTIRATDVPDVGTNGTDAEIAAFQFVVDWMDPVYLNPPNFRRLVLNDTHAQLVLDVVSQCNNHYYTEDCSVYCKSDKVHYTCLDNGTIDCLPGWTGPKCLTMIDYCPGNKCEHGSTCVPILLNYTCTCAPEYTGHLCDTLITTTATPGTLTTTISAAPGTTPKTTITTTTVTTTTMSSTNQSRSVISGSDGDNVAGVAAGVTVGLLLLLALVLALVYYIMKKKGGESKVSPEKNQTLDEEGQMSTPKTAKDASDLNGIDFKEDMKPKEEILRSLNEL